MKSRNKPAPKPNAATPGQVPRKENKAPAAALPIQKEESFIRYVISRPDNRRYLLAALLINLVLLLVYKYCYPFPDLNTDGQGYIFAAASNQKVYYRPFGYARFLQLLRSFTFGAYAVVAAQYFLVVLAAQFCFFTTDYFFPFKHKAVKACTWLLISVNPVLLVLSNALLSDILFIALSITWFALLLWTWKRKSWLALLLQLVILYWCFQVRYNALYYPLVAAAVFGFAPGMKLPYRLAGAIGSLLLITATYTGIKNTTYKTTGADVFAGFSGWQAANNALFIYKRADIRTEDFDDPELQLLDKFVKRYIDSIPAEEREQIARNELQNSSFLWNPGSPLKKYLFYYLQKHRINYFQAWYRVSPLYSKYAMQIIKDHPEAYFRHFLLPNLWYEFVPTAEFMEKYNGDTAITPLTRQWLDVKGPVPLARAPRLKEALIRPYPVLHGILQLFGLIVPAVYLIRSRRRQGAWQRDSLLPVLFWYLFLLSDILFSLIAGVVTLRYGAALFVTGFTLPLVFLDRLLVPRAAKPEPAHA